MIPIGLWIVLSPHLARIHWINGFSHRCSAVFVHQTEEKMSLVPAAQLDDLLRQLRRFSANHVKISARDQEWARGLVDNVLKERVFRLCEERSRLPIKQYEYTGSVYEHLKTGAADEVDVMMVLNTGAREVLAEELVPGKEVDTWHLRE